VITSVNIVCRTSLDGYGCEDWPTKLQVRPVIGDRIAAKSGRSLAVVSVRHDYDGTLAVELRK